MNIFIPELIMKYLVLIPDGMADRRVTELDDMTPMQRAYKPCMDSLAKESLVGTVNNVPVGMVPESDTANMSILSFDPKVYSRGRSPLEAVSMGIEMQSDETAFRCNLVTLSEEQDYENKIMIDHSADEITTEEADQLIKALQEHFGNDQRKFYTGVSYRHCLIWKNQPENYPFMRPHDILGQCIKEHLPVSEGGEEYYAFMKESYEVLKDHPVNLARKARGLRPANSAWLWSPGKKPTLPSFSEKWGIRGAVISAVDLIKGIGLCAQMKSFDVPGATGNVHTNYEGKAQAAIDAFKSGIEFVYIHVEAPDECGHRGEIENKVLSIELIDQKILKPVLEYLNECEDDFKIMVLPDHPTPIEIRTHSSEDVPFMLYDSRKVYQGVEYFDEYTARQTEIHIEHGHDLLDMMIEKDADTDASAQPTDNGQKKKSGIPAAIFDYLEIFAVSIAAVLLIFSFCARLCRVDGESMKNSFEDGQMLIISDLFYTPDNGDVIVFHQTEGFQKPLVKRVIAIGGQTVELNFAQKSIIITDTTTGKQVDYSDEFAVYYNETKTDFGQQYEWRDNLNEQKVNATYDSATGTYTFEVPKGMLFVMGDNRNYSGDSRMLGFIDERTVLGKALIRINPFTVYFD